MVLIGFKNLLRFDLKIFDYNATLEDGKNKFCDNYHPYLTRTYDCHK
jgi:hypothetical protein